MFFLELFNNLYEKSRFFIVFVKSFWGICLPTELVLTCCVCLFKSGIDRFVFFIVCINCSIVWCSMLINYFSGFKC